MSNKLIDLEGLTKFYTLLQEEFKLYAMKAGPIKAPTIVSLPPSTGHLAFNINITNNDSRALTFYWQHYGSGEVSSTNFENYAVVESNETYFAAVGYGGEYTVKAYSDDGIESDVYTVTIDTTGGGGYA